MTDAYPNNARLSAEELRSIFIYDPQTGIFLRDGERAGSVGYKGYIRIRINGRAHAAHRLAWLFVYGQWPTGVIDHKNGIPDDNRIINLRDATRGQNQYNAVRRKDNSSGFKGVFLDKNLQMWIARIMVHRKRIFLGAYNDLNSAAMAYDRAAIKHHGKFARTNFPICSYG